MKVSSPALEELKKALEKNENPHAGVRFFAQQGCCGPALQMEIADRLSPGDEVVTIDNVNFFVENEAEKMLADVTIDYGTNGFRLEGLKKQGGCC